MKNFLVTILLVVNLMSSALADDLTLAVKAHQLEIKHLKQVVELSMTCHEELGPNEYSENFCQDMKDEHRGFDFYARESNKEIDAYEIKLSQEMNSPNPTPEVAALKKMIDDAYENCISKTTGQAYYASQPALKEVVSESNVSEELKKNILFPYSDDSDSFSMDPDVMNSKFMTLISDIKYSGFDQEKQILDRMNQVAQRAMKLRREVYLENPELLLHVANQRDTYITNEESFWGSIYEETGLSQKDFNEKQQKAFRSRVAIGKVYDLLYDYRITDRPQSNFKRPPTPSELSIKQSGQKLELELDDGATNESDKPLLTVDILVKETGLSPEEATEALLKFNIHDSKSHGSEELTPLVVSILSGPKREEVLALRAEYDKVIADIKQIENEEYDDDYESNSEDDSSEYCQEQKEGIIRDFASARYIADFYNDPTNLKFINETYSRAVDLMKSAIEASGLSQESKQKLPLHLDEAKLDIPNIGPNLVASYMKDTSELYFKARKLDPDFSSSEIISSLKMKMGYTDKYTEMGRLSNFLGVNASYTGDDEDGYEGHFVNCTCGMSGKAIQQHNPDFLLGVLGHELGHALDPSTSARTRNQYSEHSLEMINSLRACLIKNNNNLWTKSGEDFADHWEALLREQMIKEDSQKADWPLRRLKMILEQYSNICEDKENVIENHSINSYRFAHIYSHPALQKEYSEYQLPTVSFCEDLRSSSEK